MKPPNSQIDIDRSIGFDKGFYRNQKSEAYYQTKKEQQEQEETREATKARRPYHACVLLVACAALRQEETDLSQTQKNTKEY